MISLPGCTKYRTYYVHQVPPTNPIRAPAPRAFAFVTANELFGAMMLDVVHFGG